MVNKWCKPHFLMQIYLIFFSGNSLLPGHTVIPCVQEVVTPIYIVTHYINWGNYFLDTRYYMPKKYWPILHSKLLYKMVPYFLDIQYNKTKRNCAWHLERCALSRTVEHQLWSGGILVLLLHHNRIKMSARARNLTFRKMFLENRRWAKMRCFHRRE